MSAELNWRGVNLGRSAALTGGDGKDNAAELQRTIDAVFGSVPPPANGERMAGEVLLNVSKPKSCSPIVNSGLYSNRFKLILDRLTAAVLLVFLLPALLVITGCIVAFGGPGSPIFRHPRIGKDGRPFACLKFRTMCANAEAVLNERLSRDTDALAEWTATQKLRNDPRGLSLRAVFCGQHRWTSCLSFGMSYKEIWRSSALGL